MDSVISEIVDSIVNTRQSVIGIPLKVAGVNLKKLKRKPEEYASSLKIRQLVNLLKSADDFYYNTGKTLVPDKIYDIVREVLEEKSPRNKYLKQIRAPVRKGKVRLPYFMPSLNKVKPETLEKWLATHPGPYVISDKMDGVSLLIEGGKKRWNLYSAGTGQQGQDLAHLAPFIRLPKAKSGIVVRAEIILSGSVFKKYAKKFENARNMMSGLLNREKGAPALKRAKVIGYEVIKPSMKPSAQFKKLKSLGFKTASYLIVKKLTPDSLAKFLKRRKKTSKFKIDGMVVTQNMKYKRVKTGNPDYSVAFKMVTSDQIAQVTVKKIIWQPSKYGYLIPVITIEGIKLGGVTIKRISGHNARFIVDKGIGPGALIELIRSGDVIPKVHSVIKKAKPTFPKERYEWDESGVNLILLDKKEVKEVHLKRVTSFFRIIGVEFLSHGIISMLIGNGLDTIPKIIKASEKRLLKVPRIKERTASKIRDGIDNALKNIPLYKLMFASGVFGKLLGSRRLKIICDRYPTIAKKKRSKELIVKAVSGLPGFSDTTASEFAEGLPKYQRFFKTLPKEKVKVAKPKKIKKIGTKLENENIVFTGFRDKDLESLIEKHGGKIGSGISSKTTILLVKDEGTTSRKAEKARGLGVKVMTSDRFLRKYKL